MSGPPAGAMFASESCAAAGVMLMLVAFIATWGHGDILTQAAAEDPVYVCDPTVARVCVEVHGSLCH